MRAEEIVQQKAVLYPPGPKVVRENYGPAPGEPVRLMMEDMARDGDKRAMSRGW